MDRNPYRGTPNMAANMIYPSERYSSGGCPFKVGQWNWIDVYMLPTADLPAVCDVGLYDWGKPNEEGKFTDSPWEMPLDIEQQPLRGYVLMSPKMKTGIWALLGRPAEGNCCGEQEDWGISKLINYINAQPANREAHPEEMKYCLVNGDDLHKAKDADGNNIFKEAEAHRGISVALNRGTFYTIEALNGPVYLFNPLGMISVYNGGPINRGRHITKVKKDLYESNVETITIQRREETQIVGADTSQGQGKVPVGSDKVLGTQLVYYWNDNPNYVGRAEVPAILDCPNLVLQKGESVTVKVGGTLQDPWQFMNLWGLFMFCLNEEDYAGIKITEGVEPYSVLEAERIAAGATKFNLQVKFGTQDDGLSGWNEPKYEYNIRLVDTTEDDGYVRYLTNEIKKSYDLDEFSLVGHHHTTEDLEDIDELRATIPKMILSTQTLSDGLSPLEENHFHFVYEGE